MIYDCFTFFNELDVLEIRLNHLYDIVDKFVLVEADKTFTEIDKPFYFEENKKRYKKFLDKIIHVKVTDYPERIDASDINRPWQIETHQRNCILRGLENVKDNDIIIISDCDEIPSYTPILTYKGKVRTCIQLQLCYFLNNQNMSNPNWALGSTILYYKLLSNPGDVFINHLALKYTKKGTPQYIRFYTDEYVINSGWHFSWMGGAKAIQKKIKSYSHTENNKEKYTNIKNIEQKLREGVDIFGKGEIYKPQPIVKDKFPDYLVENQDKYKNLILNWA